MYQKICDPSAPFPGPRLEPSAQHMASLAAAVGEPRGVGRFGDSEGKKRNATTYWQVVTRKHGNLHHQLVENERLEVQENVENQLRRLVGFGGVIVIPPLPPQSHCDIQKRSYQ